MARRVSSPTFVGRRAELDRLADVLAAEVMNRPTLVLLAGEAGIGKSRLLQETLTRAREAGARTLQGGCIDLGGSLPYGPIVEILRNLIGQLSAADIDRALGSGRAELMRLLPELGRPAEGAGRSDREPAAAQGLLFEHVLGLLLRLSEHRPLVVGIEDIHWADHSTLDLLRFLVIRLRDSDVLLVVTFRTDELYRSHPLLPFLAEMERSGRAERFELDRFDRRETEQLLNGILAATPTDDVVERVYRRSDGNAFFAEELVAAGLDRRDLTPSLRDVLLARVAKLRRTTQDVLSVVAVAGREVSIESLESVSSLDRDALLEALREAVAGHLLVARDSATGEVYRFRHALTQEAIYADLLATDRVKLHAAFAAAISGEPGSAADLPRAAELAHHWYAAHDLPMAFMASAHAGQVAEQAYAYAEALAQYERVLALWEAVPEASMQLGFSRLDLLERTARMASFVTADRAVELIREAIDLVDAQADPMQAGLLHERLGRYSWLSGTTGAEDAYRTAVRLIPEDPPSRARARVLAGLAQFLQGGSDTEGAALARQAIEISRAIGAKDIEARALVTLGSCLGILGRVEESIESCEEAKVAAAEAGAVEELVRAHKYVGGTLSWVGRNDEAAAVLVATFDLAKQFGFAESHGLDALYTAFWVLMASGRWQEAADVVDLMERHRPRAPSALAARILHAAPAWLAINHGRPEEAEQRAAALDQLAENDEEGDLTQEANAVHIAIAVLRRRPREARRLMQQRMEVLKGREQPPQWNAFDFALGLRAEADIAETSRRPEELKEAEVHVEDYLGRMRALHEETLRERPVYAAQTGALLSLCAAEAGRARRDSRSEDWAAVRWAFDALGQPFEVGYARYREAEALLRADEHAAAREPLVDAYATARTLGADALRSDVERLARRARIKLPDESPVEQSARDRHGLTRREHDVLELLVAGKTNRQISAALFISEKTVGAHVSSILAKLDARGRTEAAAVAQREGLVALAPS